MGGRWAGPGRPRPLAAHSALCLVERRVAGGWRLGGAGRETWVGEERLPFNTEGEEDMGGHSHTKQKIKLNKN